MKEAGVFPHTSQSGSAFKGRSNDTAAVEAGVDADATAEEEVADADADAVTDAVIDASGEGGVGEEEGTDNDGNVEEVDGTVAAPDGFPPFFFVMGWCVGVLEVRRAVAGASAASVQHTRRPAALDKVESGERMCRAGSQLPAPLRPA